MFLRCLEAEIWRIPYSGGGHFEIQDGSHSVTMAMAMGTKSYMNLQMLSYVYANVHAFVKLCTIFMIYGP